MILAGDVGATKILLEAGDFRSGAWQALLARRYQIADYDSFHAVIEAFLEEWEEVRPARARITASAVGVAGPVQGNKVKMTHRAWIIDGDAVARRFSIPRVRIVNDLAAGAHGIDRLAAKDFKVIQPGKAAPGGPRAVLGVGTGLGIAYLVPDGRDAYEVLPGEGGHMGFGPASAQQAELWSYLFALHGRVEAEDVVSGRGISNIYEFLRSGGDVSRAPAEKADPAWISRSATERGDPVSREALRLFAECIGNVAGDHALAVMARGGVFLAGGVAAKIAPHLDIACFRGAFCAKGAFSSHVMKIPVRAVINEHVAVLGAARWALRD